MPDVPVKGFGVVSFPDTMSDEAIHAALRRRFHAPAEATRTQAVSGANIPPHKWIAPALPFLAGAAGGAIGGIPGATIGGMLGKTGEQALTGTLPSNLKQGIRTIGGSGVEQGALQTGGELIGGIPWAIGKFASHGTTTTAIKKAVETVRNISAAKNISGPTVKAVEQAFAERQATGAAAAEAIASSHANGAEKITIGEIVQKIIDNKESKFGRPMDMKARQKLFNQVRSRMDELIPGNTLGMIKGGKTAWDLPDANVIKQEFQQVSSPTYNAAAKGLKPRPKLDPYIASSFRTALEDRVPGLRELNQAAQNAITKHQELAQFAERQPIEEINQLRLLQGENVAKAKILSPSSESMIGLHAGIPPGMTIKPPRMAAVADVLSGVAKGKKLNAAMKLVGNTPRALAFLIQHQGGTR